MNLVTLEIKRKEKFGWYQSSQRRYQVKVFAGNMTKEQADKFEAALRKAALLILPIKEKDDKGLLG
jgi:hypothetical protein